MPNRLTYINDYTSERELCQESAYSRVRSDLGGNIEASILSLSKDAGFGPESAPFDGLRVLSSPQIRPNPTYLPGVFYLRGLV